jgi:hypothetical protein
MILDGPQCRTLLKLSFTKTCTVGMLVSSSLLLNLGKSAIEMLPELC